MKSFLIICLLFITTALSAQQPTSNVGDQAATELVSRLDKLMVERNGITVSYNTLFLAPYIQYLQLHIPDMDTFREDLKKNTLRLEEVVADLESIELALSVQNKDKLFDAKKALYDGWLETSKFNNYDYSQLKVELAKYLGKKNVWLLNLDTLVSSAMEYLTSREDKSMPLTPEDVIIKAKIFPYYVEKLDKSRAATMGEDLRIALLLQAGILDDLHAIEDAGVDIALLIGYSDRLYRYVGLLCPESVDAKAGKAEILAKIMDIKTGFEEVKSLLK